MTLLEEIVQANDLYLNSKEKVNNSLSSKPTRRVLIITCIDCRLVDLLEPAIGIARGEANIIKTAGNYIPPEFNDTIKSILVAVFELGVEEIIVMGHYNCGVAAASKEGLISKMIDRGLPVDHVHNMAHSIGNWLDDYPDPKDNVLKSVANLRNCQLIPDNIPVHGMIIEPNTGAIEILSPGYK